MGYNLFEVKMNGYYSGEGKKYDDMFDITTKEFAKIFLLEDAIKIKRILNKKGYHFWIVSK